MTKDGQKIIYNTEKLSSFSQDLLSEIVNKGETPEAVDEIADKYNGHDTFGIVMDENRKPWSSNMYLKFNILDDPKNRKEFLLQYQNSHIRTSASHEDR